ncbi:signal recognition particle-docking protein FtsY [Desulfogranum marinum]|uniref:signal recognition particle-docking protein FtsY n=1 Tax=Desulfogranum marinum TaxID=453220 RepID=UPI0019646CE3|nr:signal recognition particle-docking protein FtsY [Desulfogranum marinum]MBM9512750.1 signal recognition particle-docking protein FtsY [Desulfogranum marinum]
MLGWFKKKFGRKKKAESEGVEVAQEVEVEESIAPESSPVAETPQVERDEFPAVEKEIPIEDVQPDEVQAAVLPAEEEAQKTPAEQIHADDEGVAEPASVEESQPVDAQPDKVEEILPAGEVEVDEQVSEKPTEVPTAEKLEQTEAIEPEEALVDESEQEAVEVDKEPLDLGRTEADTAGEVETAVEQEVDVVKAADDVADVVHAIDVEEAPQDVDQSTSAPAEGTAAEEKLLIDEEEELAEEDVLQEQEEQEAEAVAPVQKKTSSPSLFKRLHQRLGKTRDSFVYRMDTLFLGRKEIDQELFDDLEEILITADLGVETTMDLLEHARKTAKRDQLSDPKSLKKVLRDRIYSYIESSDQPAELVMPDKGPFVIMVIGVNGVGKTTTIGKVANKFVNAGQSVLLVAGDTFRAAAIDQLKIWGERVGVEVVAQQPGADPSSVVFDGMEYGIAHKFDVIIIDTAGRLHTSVNLMEELKKIKRVIGKKLPKAPHEVMLVLDATTGQNGISQAKLFDAAVDVTGLTMSKLDGTAKGGIVANICREMKIPVRFIGIGEQMDDLRDFDSREFVDALFADREEE